LRRFELVHGVPGPCGERLEPHSGEGLFEYLSDIRGESEELRTRLGAHGQGVDQP
jgi:hypothetical protein